MSYRTGNPTTDKYLEELEARIRQLEQGIGLAGQVSMGSVKLGGLRLYSYNPTRDVTAAERAEYEREWGETLREDPGQEVLAIEGARNEELGDGGFSTPTLYSTSLITDLKLQEALRRAGLILSGRPGELSPARPGGVSGHDDELARSAHESELVFSLSGLLRQSSSPRYYPREGTVATTVLVALDVPGTTDTVVTVVKNAELLPMITVTVPAGADLAVVSLRDTPAYAGTPFRENIDYARAFVTVPGEGAAEGTVQVRFE